MLTICLVFQGHVLREQLRKDNTPNTPVTKLFKSKERVVLKAKKLYARILHQKICHGLLRFTYARDRGSHPTPPPGPGKEGEKGSGIKQRQSKEEKLILLNMISKYKITQYNIIKANKIERNRERESPKTERPTVNSRRHGWNASHSPRSSREEGGHSSLGTRLYRVLVP